MTSKEIYDNDYFCAHCGPSPYQRDANWLAFFNGIAAEIIRSLAPRTVYDAGCAMGMLVESLWDRGVEARGGDISTYAISQVRPDMVPHCRVLSITEPLDAQFDLITCIEVLEHLTAEEAQKAIEVLAASTDAILFSSTPSDSTEPTHINVQPPIAWIRAFGRQGFRPDVRYDASFLSPHAMLFRRLPTYESDDVDDFYALHIFVRTALTEREARIGRLDARVEALQKSEAYCGDLEAKLAAHDNEAALARQELEEARENLLTKDRELAKIHRSFDEARRSASEAIESKEREVGALRLAVDAMKQIRDQDVNDVKEQLSRAVRERDRQHRSAEESMRRFEEAQRSVSDLRTAASAAAEQLASAEERAARSVSVIENLTREVIQLRSALARAPSADEYEAAIRERLSIEKRYRDLMRADTELFTMEANRLRAM